jgi:hypothetical protein
VLWATAAGIVLVGLALGVLLGYVLFPAPP